MKATLDTTTLGAALRTVSRVAGTYRGGLPVLAGVQLEAVDGQLTLQATNLDVTVDTACAADVAETGIVVVPARLLDTFVGKLDAGTVSLDSDGETLTVRSGEAKLSARLFDAVEWPKVADLDGFEAGIVTDAWRNLARVVEAADIDPTHGVKHAVHFGPDGIAATDGYRLHAWGEPIGDVEASVPVELLRAIGTPDGKVTFVTDGHLLAVTTPAARWRGRLIEGDYPDWRRMMETYLCTHRLTVDTDALVAAMDRVTLFDVSVKRETRNVTMRHVTFETDGGKLRLSASGLDVGDADDVITCEGDTPGPMVLDAGYLRDLVTAAPSAEVTLEMSDDRHPVILRDPPFVGLLMPVRRST